MRPPNPELDKAEGKPEQSGAGLNLGPVDSPRAAFLIEQAAAIEGKTPAEFMLDGAAARARYVLVHRSRLGPSEASRTAILEAIDRPAIDHPYLKMLVDCAGNAAGHVVVEKFEVGFDLAGFDCGHAELNDWVLHFALPGQLMDYVQTGVIRSGPSVVGYHALVVEGLAVPWPAGAFGSTSPPAIRAMILMRLAVDTRYQKHGLGRALVRDAVMRFASQAESRKADVLLVQAKNESVRQFYMNCGFTPLLSEPLILFLTLKDVRKSLA
jgi:uncharacterized protein (DUF1778 family)